MTGVLCQNSALLKWELYIIIDKRHGISLSWDMEGRIGRRLLLPQPHCR